MSEYEQSSYYSSTVSLKNSTDLTNWKNAMYTFITLLCLSICINNVYVSRIFFQRKRILNKVLHIFAFLCILVSIIIFSILWSTHRDDLDEDEDAKNASWVLLALILVSTIINIHSGYYVFSNKITDIYNNYNYSPIHRKNITDYEYEGLLPSILHFFMSLLSKLKIIRLD